MLADDQYYYLDDALRHRPTVKPHCEHYAFGDGHVPVHQQCHITATHLETTRGWGAQLGIQWLDKGGRLLPWPHVVNWVGGSLVDYSHSILEPKLGFTLIGNDVAMFGAVTASTEEWEVGGPGSAWADPWLWRLHCDWFTKLKQFSQSPQAEFDRA